MNPAATMTLSPATLDERRGEAMRALFPMLFGWKAGRSSHRLPARVYARLAEAKTLEDLERRLPRTLPNYPTEAIEEVWLRDGRSVLVRPVVPADAPLQRAFILRLSEQSRQRRFHGGVAEPPPSMLRYLTDIDYVDHFALVGEVCAECEVRHVAEARWVRRRDEPHSADFAIVVADDYAGRGFGGRLLDALERSAAARGIERLHGSVLRGNLPMLRWLEARGWTMGFDPSDPGVVAAVCALRVVPAWREAA